MLIVLTHPNQVKKEAEVIQQLFNAGLATLHLRKPFFTIEETRGLIEQLAPQFHKRVVLHQYHELCEELNLKGIHFKENQREQLGSKLTSTTEYYKANGFTVSSSFHDLESIEQCPVLMDYYFLAPVFTSISKKDYPGKGFNVTQSNKKIIALGGVTTSTITQTNQLGYSGAAVLGTVWQNENPLSAFREIQALYS